MVPWKDSANSRSRQMLGLAAKHGWNSRGLEEILGERWKDLEGTGTS